MTDQRSKNTKEPSVPESKGPTQMSRRNFLKNAGVAVAGMSLPLGMSACDGGVGVQTLTRPAAPTGIANVGVVRKSDVAEMVRSAVELAGGLDEINAGDTVLIKPNITYYDNPNNPRITTTPEVLRTVIQMVKERTGARNITMGEATAFNGNTRQWAQQTGLLAVTQSEGVNFVAWETGSYTTVRIQGAQYLTHNFRIPTTVANGSFDHWINIPILKNHEMIPGANAEYTCCIKLQMGMVHQSDRNRLHTRNLGNLMAEVNVAIPKTTMNVVDALEIVLTNGPGSDGEHGQPGLIIASKDRVAADSLSVAVLRLYAQQQRINRPYVNKSVWRQAQITQAQQMNLGRQKSNIVVLDEGVDNIADILEMWA